MTATFLGAFGGSFSLLTLAHFATDWLLQTHAEAMAKSHSFWIRARHCAVYTVGVALACVGLGLRGLPLLAAAVLLFGSHLVEDTYVPVFLWAKYVRQPPQLSPFPAERPNVWDEARKRYAPRSDRDSFKAWMETPLGLLLVIAVDQIIHIACLLPIAYAIALRSSP